MNTRFFFSSVFFKHADQWMKTKENKLKCVMNWIFSILNMISMQNFFFLFNPNNDSHLKYKILLNSATTMNDMTK